MKIVVVDHVHLQEKHVRRLQSLGQLDIYREPPQTAQELEERITEAEIIIVGWSKLTRNIISVAKKLTMISIWATSCHYADVDAAKQRGIVVSHVPGYATEAVAEHVYALLLAAVRKIRLADEHVRNGSFDWRPFTGIELQGKTLGIIGTGSIGFRVAEIAQAFRMKVLGYDKYPNEKRAQEAGLKYVDLPSLLRESDTISIHVTLTSETEGLIGKTEIETMKNGAVIVNTSQGKVINEKALIEALKSGKILYAGLDVFEEEPPSRDNPLFKLDNTVVTPHIGFNTVEAAERCTDICIDNVAKFLEGKPQNLC